MNYTSQKSVQSGLRLVLTFALITFVSIAFLNYSRIQSFRNPYMMSNSTTPTAKDIKPLIPLSQFLKESRKEFLQALKDKNSLDKWTIVSGNEAGDLDSLSSAVCYAYLQHRLYGSGDRKIIALILIKQSDLKLRPENLLALEDCKISPQDLLTLDDLPSDMSLLTSISLALVDHNVPETNLKFMKVTAIIDHHEDEMEFLEASPRVVRKCGSCSALVTTHFASFLAGSPMMPTELADLLIYSLLIDTANMKPAPKGKAEDVDRAAMSTLHPLSSFADSNGFTASQSTLKMGKKFEQLSQAKTAVSFLSPFDLLRRDYKEFSTQSGWKVGAAQVVLPLREAFIRSSTEESLSSKHLNPVEDWYQERKVDISLVLTTYAREGDQSNRGRELLIFIPSGNSELQTLLFEKFPKESTELDLEAWPHLAEGMILETDDRRFKAKAFKQRNVKATRKQVVPAIRAILDDFPKPNIESKI